MNDVSEHDAGHLALFRYCEKFILQAGPLGAARSPGWELDAQKLRDISTRGEAATMRAIANPDDTNAEHEMHSAADAFMDISEKYISLFPKREAREYFYLLNDADLESEHEPYG